MHSQLLVLAPSSHGRHRACSVRPAPGGRDLRRPRLGAWSRQRVAHVICDRRRPNAQRQGRRDNLHAEPYLGVARRHHRLDSWRARNSYGGAPPADTDNEAAESPLPPVINTFEEFEEMALPPASGHTFTGSGFYNSGVMTNVPAASGFPTAVQHYSLQIEAAPGTYFFYCLVHGSMMSQLVTVISSGQAYPYSQGQYNAHAATERASIRRGLPRVQSDGQRRQPQYRVRGLRGRRRDG